MQIREYGASGPAVIVLHGGPGASGYMAPVARGIADSFRVLEPLQRGSGGEPLTVARHIADLHELVAARCGDERPAIAGHSWGAMLALAYAAAHPACARALALIGCGTFDPAERERVRAIREERMDDTVRRRIRHLREESPDPDDWLKVLGGLSLMLDSFDLISTDLEVEAYDGRAHHETWNDMLRLQEEGVYPAAFAAINVPVAMLHGAFDPHPGPMIREGLAPYLPRLEYYEWQRCGHYPWLEKAVHGEFFAALRSWLARQFTGGEPPDDRLRL